MEPLLTNLLSDPLPTMLTMQRYPPPTAPPTSPGPGEAAPPGLPSSGPRESASYARRRAGTACVVCRARKTKCDNQRPVCGFCRATGGECRYPGDTVSDHSKLDRGSLAILQRLGEMEQSITALLRQDQSRQPYAAQATTPEGPAPEHVQSRTPGSDVGSGFYRTQDHHRDDQPPTADIIFESAEMTIERILRWPVFEQGEIPPLASSLGRADVLKPATGDNIFDLELETVAQLVENFLATNHIKNPIFDVEDLWVKVKEFVDGGLRWNGTTCLVLLICAVSVLSPPIRLERQPGFSRRADRLARAEMYFQASQRRIGVVYHENSLLTMQCSFLSAVYLMTTFRILAAWKAFSQAGTQCVGWLATRGRMAEGRHSFSPTRSNTNETGDKERYVEESLYWSCLKSELELRAELGLPGSSLNEMHYPHVYPSPPTPAQSIMSSGTFPVADPESARKWLELGWFFYLAEIALRRIMNEALSSRYWRGSWYYTTNWWSLEEQGHFSTYVDEFKQKLQTWYDMLPPPMNFPREAHEPVGDDPLRGILRAHVIDILDVVLFPAVQAVVCRPSGEVSHSVLTIAREALATALDRITICHEGYWHRHQGTWLMIRTCSRSALQLLGVALRVQQDAREGRDTVLLTDFLPNGWREAVASVIDLVAYWEAESPELASLLVRLKELYNKVQIE